jgi:protein tyrosine/serine phosphatase
VSRPSPDELRSARPPTRHLEWEGAFNVRDLGGLETLDGRTTRWRALVRADSLGALTAAGWSALAQHGVRTVIDLRNESERHIDAAARPSALTTVHLPLDAVEDRAFWDSWEESPGFGTPMYYRPHVERFPERSARVIAQIARAGPGGVAYHCVSGRDRTGQITVLLLALLRVAPERIADDYEHSAVRLTAAFAARGESDHGIELRDFLAARRTNARELILATLAALDVERLLCDAGLTREDLALLRARALDA